MDAKHTKGPDLAAALSTARALAGDAATLIQSHRCEYGIAGPPPGGCPFCAALLALDNLDKLATAALDAAEGKDA